MYKIALLSVLLLFSLSFWGCKENIRPLSSKNSRIVYPDSVDQAIHNRFKFMDKQFFKGDTANLLRPEQREALYPILGEKIRTINAAKKEAKNRKELQAKRSAIREAWHPKINAVLNSGQILLKQTVLGSAVRE